MGRKTILKQLVDIVLMLKQFSSEGDTTGVKRSGKYSGDRGIGAPTGSETPLRPSPLFPNLGTKNYAPEYSAADHGTHRETQRNRIKVNRKTEFPADRIPKGAACEDCGGDLPT